MASSTSTKICGNAIKEIEAALRWASTKHLSFAESDAIVTDQLDTSAITIRQDHLYLLLRQSEMAPWRRVEPDCMKFEASLSKIEDRASKYLFHPIPDKDHIFYKNFITQLALYWHPHELKNPPNDFANWYMIPRRYQELFVAITGFFVIGDTLITRVLHRFCADSPCLSATASITAQMFMETIHMDAYGLFASLIPDKKLRNEAICQVNDLECVKAKARYIEKWMDNDTVPRWQKYIAAAATEGIFFASLFAIIFYFRKTKYFNEFITLNTWIMRDETIHRNQDIQLAIRVAMDDGHVIDDHTVHTILKEAVEVEKSHIAYILKDPIENEEADREMGVLPEQLMLYIYTLANQISYLTRVSPVYNSEPFTPSCMDGMDSTVKEDFYTVSTSQYQHFKIHDVLSQVAKWTTSSSHTDEVVDSQRSDEDF